MGGALHSRQRSIKVFANGILDAAAVFEPHCCRNSIRSIVLYCILFYLSIYIALLAVHTNQKRFQCERPREKRAVLRERKEALGSPVNKVDRVVRRSWFQSEGSMIAKARV